jgi:hypothetical protein
VVKSVIVPGKCYAISDGDRPGNPSYYHDLTMNFCGIVKRQPISIKKLPKTL